jgi:hypothetical protein
MFTRKQITACALGLSLLVIAQLGLHSDAKASTTSTTYYVSKTGSNGDGRSWATAWNELDQINWAAIQAGDTVLLDGGSSQMVYTTAMTVGASGNSSAPITVKLAPDAGRNGQVVIFGGRSTPLPYCDQPTYTYDDAGANQFGIHMENASYVTIDGTKWSGISIYGNNRSGVKLVSGSVNDTLRYMEIYDNGEAVLHPQTNAWRPDQPGINLGGTGVVFDHMLIHDNGQDGFQSGGSGISNITLSNSWIYNLRPHPSNPSLSYNFCMHSDGMQIYNGGNQSGVTFSSDILGPGLMQGTLLGQTPSMAQVDNVTFNNVLILDTTNANIMGYPTVQSLNWSVNNVTSFHVAYDPDGSSHSAIFLEGSGHHVNNSIFYGGTDYLPNGVSTGGNFQYNNTGYNLGTVADPLFVNAPAYNSQPTLQDLANGDYALQPGSPATGKGSAITSVSVLIGQPPATATPQSSPTSTQPAATATYTATPIATNTGQPTSTSTYQPTSTSTQPAGTATRTATNTNTPQATNTSPPGSTNTPTPTDTNTPQSTSTATSQATGTSEPPPPTDTSVPGTATDTPGPGTPTTTPTCNISFVDVEQGSTFYPYIECLACRAVIAGYSDGTFRPGDSVTRGQLSKIVSNAAGFTDEPAGQTFQDVVPGSTFYLFVERMAIHGAVSGYACGGTGEPCGPNNLPYFRPQVAAIRGQIAKIVALAAGLSGTPSEQIFEDVPPGHTYYQWIELLAQQGVMSGYPCGGAGEPCGPNNLPYFRPQALASRGQVTKIVSNVYFPVCAP